MQFKSSFVSLLVLALSTATVHGATVRFYGTRSCSGNVIQEFRNPGCNICFDPPGDFFAIEVTDIGPNQRVSNHNQDRCTPASSVGQGFGPQCRVAGNTALRSAWVACEGQRLNVNSTEVSNAAAAAGPVPTVSADDA